MTSEWKFDFNTYLSSGLGYIVLEVDGAGSSGQGQVRKEPYYSTAVIGSFFKLDP